MNIQINHSQLSQIQQISLNQVSLFEELKMTDLSISFIAEQDKKILQTILKFLTRKEICRMSQTNKLMQENIISYQQQLQNEEYQTWKKNKIEKLMKFKYNLKKKQQQAIKVIETEQNYIVKMRIFDIPQKYLEQQNWRQIDKKDIEFNSISCDKFVKQNNNIFFKNTQCNDVIYINRSLIDQSLNISENLFNEEEHYQQNKYKELYQGDQFTQTNFDFSNMESLLTRQRQIIQKLNQKEEIKQFKEQNIEYLKQLQLNKKITIILCHGGYFSVGIFNEKGECTFHKSDHKYVVRKKAGKRQITCGKGVSSIGSQIRLDQEKKHQEKVHNILTDKYQEIDSSEIVFLHAPGINKLLLIKENEPLMKIQHKLRSICLTPKKANYTEVERIYKAITKIYFVFKK